MLHKTLLATLLWAFCVLEARAAQAQLQLEIPRLQVAEYHSPYLAVWARSDTSGAITNLALWYQIDDDREGEKWLKDLRQWWRRSGRSLEMPADGFTGATRKPGLHRLELGGALSELPEGAYTIYVEAVREVGGRELVKLPLQLPLVEPRTIGVEGKSELGVVSLHLMP